MLSLEADHFPSLRDGLHLWSLKNAFMQIAGTITGQSRVRSSDLGLICESRTGKSSYLILNVEHTLFEKPRAACFEFVDDADQLHAAFGPAAFTSALAAAA
jgi:hypothetical protein